MAGREIPVAWRRLDDVSLTGTPFQTHPSYHLILSRYDKNWVYHHFWRKQKITFGCIPIFGEHKILAILPQSCLCSDASTVAAATAIALSRGRSDKASKFKNAEHLGLPMKHRKSWQY
jgi:hypothetical protein